MPARSVLLPSDTEKIAGSPFVFYSCSLVGKGNIIAKVKISDIRIISGNFQKLIYLD
jgi:hypothetical protein